jgi:HAE1 family hydrophobic/amphiphilic exporter-1
VQSDLPAEKLFDELEYKIKPSIQKIDGVGEITFIGEAPREIAVNVDHKKLDKYKLSILQITQAIKESNFDFPAGKISEGDAQSLLRMSSKFKTAEEISKTVVSANPDGVIRLSDVAEVSDIQKEYKNLYRINGVQSLGVLIKKKTDANTVKVNEAIKNEFKLLEEKYKNENLKFLIPNDGSIIIKDAADSVSKDLINAIILVTILMILFLHSGRNAMIVMISVPLALIGTFIGIQLMGYTLNLMTLLALSQSIITPIIAPFAMVIVISVTISTFAALTVMMLWTELKR